VPGTIAKSAALTIAGDHVECSQAGTQKGATMFYGRFKEQGDHDFFRSALERFAKLFDSVFAADNVILFGRNLAILNDKKFSEACEKNARNDQERSLGLRLNTLTWAASEALRVPGDFVECGVWRGFCSAVIADYLDFGRVPKQLYLYDTFDGIPAQYDSEGHDAPDFTRRACTSPWSGGLRASPTSQSCPASCPTVSRRRRRRRSRSCIST